MHPALGLLGAFILAIGGFIIFASLNGIAIFLRSGGYLPSPAVYFIGFLVIGIGLWAIILSGREDKK